MQINEECFKTLLSQATELSHILFWTYNCDTSEIEISDQIALFFDEKRFPLSDQEKQVYLSRYITSIHPEDQQEFKNIISGRSQDTSGCLDYMLNIQNKIYHHKCKYTRLSEKDHNLITGSIFDETSHFSTLNILQEKDSIFEHISSHFNIGIFSWKSSPGGYYVNPQWYHNFGVSTHIQPLEAMELWPKYVIEEDYERVITTRQQLREGTINKMDVTFRININKEIRWIRYTAVVKDFGVMSGDIQVVGMNQDVTAIKQQEELNIKIIETLPDFIFIFDENFFILNIQKSKYVDLLHPIEELMNADARKIFLPEVSRLIHEAIRRCLANQMLQEIEFPLDTKSGRHYCQARMVPFEKNSVIAHIHDVSERVQQRQELILAKQKAEEADRIKSAFLANMSHEIRTPLTAIVGFSELLTETDDPEEKKNFQEIIQINSGLLLQLTNDVLDLSRMEAGKDEVVLEETDMNHLLEEIGRTYQLKMRKGVELHIECPDYKILIQTDRSRVTQVLFNFVSNAIKNTTQGSITLSLTREEKEVCLSVTDTGCGISKDKLDTIFERFVKINDFVQGTGLGLSICRTIADKLGGHIDVRSELGKGSTFSFFLPCPPAEKM
ncbi:MAG: ATP-binding protein [Odoribacter sp.]